MQKLLLRFLSTYLIVIASLSVYSQKTIVNYNINKWSIEKANTWYDRHDWIVGCNYVPANAINQLEMWQKDTFSPELIDKELSWAEDIGFNSLRVFFTLFTMAGRYCRFLLEGRPIPVHLRKAQYFGSFYIF